MQILAARNLNGLPTARIPIPRTVPRSSPASKSHEQAPRRRVEGTTPPLVSTHPVAAIQQRSTIQRRTPSRKLEGENPNGFQSRTASKPGSKSGATGFRGGRVAQGGLGFNVLHPLPLPSLYRWPRGPLGRNKGWWSPPGTPPPKGRPSHRGILLQGGLQSYSK